ncbi:hypothetical protein [uncultured Psychroserpens sp.]|uniref:hypothetical protein n=1 Tax=uncultured Psychroserpens sp. TaxID=255436 RepID=UPI0026285828|nr:hypothetical protein [uncultured Psychroserpens sp.]
MKKYIIIICTILVIASLSILAFTNWDHTNTEQAELSKEHISVIKNQNTNHLNTKKIPDLYYGVDSRFAPVKLSDVHNATTIYDFLNEGEKAQIDQINSVRLIMVENNQLSEKRAYGNNEFLTDAQKDLLKSTAYFSHFTIRTKFTAKNEETGQMEDRFFGPHITVVPNQQATYVDGKDALINYLKAQSKDYMNVIKDMKLGAIKISFKVTSEGNISDVKHDAMSTGYKSIDDQFMTLIKNIPGTWIPAENNKGETLDQELVFTFGPADGC